MSAEQDVLQLSSGKHLEGGGTVSAIFYGLLGGWEFDRTCWSDVFEEQNSMVSGTAHFLLIRSLQEDSPIHHYQEEGTIRADRWYSKCSRQYTYQLDETEGVLEIRFRSGDTTGAILHRFHVSPDESRVKEHTSQSFWIGAGDHPCGLDRYFGTYKFEFRGAHLVRFSTHYRVHGPSKDYSIDTHFHRPRLGDPGIIQP